MKGEQLELNLWAELRRAQQMPETVEVVQILNTMEVTAAQLPEAARLQFAGEALLQIAELCAARATVLMTEWEEAYRDPIVQQGFFTDLVRQTMAVDLSDLMEPTPPRKSRTKRVNSAEAEEGSVVATVDKAVLLAMVDQLESEAALEEERKQQVLQIAHDEDVSRWIEAIAQTLQTNSECIVSFADLCSYLKMPCVEVWLGVLLGNFELEQQGNFYQAPILVKIRDTECLEFP
jgi:hypothetical protein